MEALLKDTVGKLLELLGFTGIGLTVDTSDPHMIRVDIVCPEASNLIGWHGETINALQHLVKAIVRGKQGDSGDGKGPFIVLDVDGYRRAQEDRVRKIALDKADFVRRKKTRVALPPMSPYFRRIVHLFVANDPDMQDLLTESIGEGDYRQIVLKLKQGGLDEGEELTPVVATGDDMADTAPGLDNLDI